MNLPAGCAAGARGGDLVILLVSAFSPEKTARIRDTPLGSPKKAANFLLTVPPDSHIKRLL